MQNTQWYHYHAYNNGTTAMSTSVCNAFFSKNIFNSLFRSIYCHFRVYTFKEIYLRNLGELGFTTIECSDIT